MATIAKLAVQLDLDDSGFRRGLENTRAKLDSWGSSLRSLGTKLTAGVTAPLAGSGGMMVKWAADLEQTLGATEQLWGSNADTIVGWSETANKSMGLTQNEALTSANRFNAMLKQTGASMDEVSTMSMDLTARSADLSAMWGGSSIEASDALTSALRGNYEGLDKYNIVLTEAIVNEEAKAIAVADGRDEITEADKVQARYNLIMEQSSDAQGQFSREADTTAGKLAILRARVVDAATKFGKLLLPYVNRAADAISSLVTWVEGLNDTQRKWVLGIAAVAAALGPLLLIVGMLLPGISALVAVIGFLVSPIGLVVVAVAALAAGLIYAYTHFESFRDIVDTVASTIKDVAIAAFEQLVEVFNKLKDAFDTGGFSQLFATLGEMLLNGFIQLHVLAFEGVQQLAQAFWNAAPGLLSAGWALIQNIWDGAVARWPEFTGWLSGLASDAAAWIGDVASSLWQKGLDLIQGLWNGALSKWPAIQVWLSLIGSAAASMVGDMLTTLYQKGFDLISGLFQGAANRWQQFTVWAGTLATLAFAAVGEVIGTLVSKGSNIIQGFWDGATAKWTAMRTWLVNLPTMITTAIGDVWSTLSAKGSNILHGFWVGAIAKWQDVKTWFTNLGYNIVVAVGDLASSLYNAGLSIMSGLKAGLVAGWEDVKSFLSSLNPADWKGPEKRDKKMLYMPGIWIMEGLSRGLDEGWGDVTRQLSSYVPTIADGVTAGAGVGRAGQVINNHNYFVTPEALQEMIDGGKFARNFTNELGMVGGDM